MFILTGTVTLLEFLQKLSALRVPLEVGTRIAEDNHRDCCAFK